MNVVTERARELQQVWRVVAYKGEEGREHEGGKVNAERELKKRHEGRGEGGHLKEGRGDSYLVKPNFSKRFS